MIINSFEDFINASSECSEIHKINSTEWQCNFAKAVADCESGDGFINYVDFSYCTIASPVKAVIILGIWIIILFIALGNTADDFLCPAMIVISKALKFSHNVAGVTLLAFGNGSTDIFTSISSIRNSSPDMMIGELLGAGIFITTIVAGLTLIISDFKLMERPLIRDLSFYMIAVFIVWYMFFKETFDLTHSIALIVVYLTYFLVVIGSGIYYAKSNKNKDKNPEQHSDNSQNNIVFERTYFREASHSKRVSSIPNQEEGVILRRFSFRDMKSRPRNRTLSLTRHPYHHHFENALFTITKDMNQTDQEIEPNNNQKMISESDLNSQVNNSRKHWKELMIHLNPIDFESLKKDRWYLKIYTIIKAPIYFVLTLTIPVVDEENVKQNWCKLLNIMHIIISPQLFLIITKMSSEGIPKYELIILGVSSILALIVFFTSKFEKPPVYHILFAIMGAIMGIAWVYALTNEIVEVLKTIGLIFNLSDIILGLTVLSWGNSLGDLITDTNMARHGYPRIGISACFGGPLFNLLLGIGIPYTILLTTQNSVELNYSKMMTLMSATISLSLGSTLMIMIFNRFHSSKIHGIYLILLYIVFTVLAILFELSII